MKLWMLGSGSSGNAILVECEGSRVLIDCGFGTRTLAKRLKSIDVAPESIEGCLVTHEHTDHISGAASCARKWGWGVYASHGTASAGELTGANVHLFEPGMTIDFARMSFEAVRTPHDAMQSVGFIVQSRTTGARAGVFTDIGYVTRRIAKACESLDILVIESNHDEDMLMNGSYPMSLKKRISGRFGHLSNPDAGRFTKEMVNRDLQHVVLAHLSEENNSPAVAMDTMRTALAKTKFKGTITAAQQDAVVGPFVPGVKRAEAPTQYSLF